MAISFGGINTGLPPNLVDQLVELEKIPAKNVEAKKAKTENRLKLVTELDTKVRDVSGSLKELASTRGFSDIKLISGDPNIVSGALDPEGYTKGNWNVEVVKLASKAAAVSNGFPDKDSTEIGVGYFSFKTAEGTKEIFINGNNNTLEGAAKAINASNMGVRATVINDRKDPDAPFKLMIAGDALGVDNQVEYPTLYFLDGDQDFYFDEERPAENGVVKIDGYELEITDNKIEDFVPGVTLELRQAQPGKTVNISVKEDQQLVVGKVKKYVDSINAVLGFIQSQNALTEKSDTTSTLGGDSLLRTIESDFRRLVQNPQMGIDGPINRLSQIAIQFNRQGQLTFDEEKFNAVLTKNPSAVQAFFVGDNLTTGLMTQTRQLVSRMVDSSFGPLSNRKRGLQDQISQHDKRIVDLERRAANKEKQLRNQFANLEQAMSRMKAQGATIAQKMGGAEFSFGGASMNNGS